MYGVSTWMTPWERQRSAGRSMGCGPKSLSGVSGGPLGWLGACLSTSWYRKLLQGRRLWGYDGDSFVLEYTVELVGIHCSHNCFY